MGINIPRMGPLPLLQSASPRRVGARPGPCLRLSLNGTVDTQRWKPEPHAGLARVGRAWLRAPRQVLKHLPRRAQTSSTLQRVSAGFRYQLPDNWAISGVARLVQTDTNVADPLERGILFALSKTWPNNRIWP